MRIKAGAVLLLCAISLPVLTAQAMGLRSLVALPVDKGGKVIRFQLERNTDTGTDTLAASAALGLGHRQSLLLGLPYRLSPAGTDRTGDVSALYRHIILQDDHAAGTRRLGLLGGALIPTDAARDTALQAGFVYTQYRARTEWDVDVVYRKGLGQRRDSGQYDISWQYRLLPARYPEWGLGTELNGVLELNGRWQQGGHIVHQATAGLQWIHRRLVLEGGLVQDLKQPGDTLLILGSRLHF